MLSGVSLRQLVARTVQHRLAELPDLRVHAEGHDSIPDNSRRPHGETRHASLELLELADVDGHGS